MTEKQENKITITGLHPGTVLRLVFQEVTGEEPTEDGFRQRTKDDIEFREFLDGDSFVQQRNRHVKGLQMRTNSPARMKDIFRRIPVKNGQVDIAAAKVKLAEMREILVDQEKLATEERQHRDLQHVQDVAAVRRLGDYVPPGIRIELARGEVCIRGSFADVDKWLHRMKAERQ